MGENPRNPFLSLNPMCCYSASGPSKSLTFADTIKDGEDGAGGGGGDEGNSAEGGGSGGGVKKKEQKKPESCFPPFISRL